MNLTGNFDKLNQEDDNIENVDLIQKHQKSGYVRKLTLVTLDGTRKFFNYAHLMDGEFLPEENAIMLTFSTGKVCLKGHNLLQLFGALEFDSIRSIRCTDKRYSQITNSGDILVFDIIIEEI